MDCSTAVLTVVKSARSTSKHSSRPFEEETRFEFFDDRVVFGGIAAGNVDDGVRPEEEANKFEATSAATPSRHVYPPTSRRFMSRREHVESSKAGKADNSLCWIDWVHS
jgi:hypothetical protein